MPTIDELLMQHGGMTPPAAAGSQIYPNANAPMPQGIDGYAYAAGRHAGAGMDTAGEMEADLRTLSPLALMQKYGPETAQAMMAQVAAGGQQYISDLSVPGSTGGQVLKEGATNIAGGFANSVLGLGGLAVGAVSDAGGATISGWQEGVTGWQQGIEDDQTQARRRAMEARGAQRARDDAATYEAEKETHGSTLAGLRNIGREALSTIQNYGEDDSMLFAGGSTAVGSLAAGGPIGKGVKLAGAGIKGAVGLLDNVGARVVGRAAGISDDVITSNIAARNASRLDEAAARALARDKAVEAGTASWGQRAGKWIDDNGATTAGLVGMEAGGAYSQTVNEIMGKTHEQLMQGSEPYRQLIAQGVDPAEAKMQVAGDAGMEAAAKMAPTALLPAAAVSRFERNILSQGIGTRTVANVAGQAPEEAFQGGMAQIYGNQAIRNYADDQQDWTKGVGASVGEGALFGTMAAGAVQSPGLALTGAAAAGSAALKGVGAMLGGSEDSQSSSGSSTGSASPEDEVTALLQSPEVQQKIQERMAAEAQQAPPAQAPAAPGAPGAPAQPAPAAMAQPVTELVGKLATLSAASADHMSMLTEVAAPSTREVLEAGAGTGGLSIMRALMDRIQNPKPGDDVLDMADTLEQYESALFGLSGPTMDLLAQESDPLLQELHRTFTSVAEDMRTSPQYIAAKKAAGLMATEAQDQVDVTEPVQVAKVVDQVVRNAPENLNPELATHLRALHASGEVTMSDGQLAALSAAEALVAAEKVAQERLEAAGIPKDNTEKVTSQIRTENYSRGKEGRVRSMAEHVRTIIGAATSGNLPEARAQIEAMHDWAQGQANKIEAYNQALREGKSTSADTVKYTTRSWKGEMVESKEGVFINPAAPKSVELAQRAHADAVALTAAYNGIAAAFPDLGMPQLPPPVLAPELQGKAADVAARNGTSQAGTPITRQNRTGTEAVSTAAATPTNDMPPPPPPKKKAEEYQHPKGFTMSKSGMAFPYAKWKEAGWTDEDLVEAGHMTANQEEAEAPAAPPTPPAPPSKPAVQASPGMEDTAPHPEQESREDDSPELAEARKALRDIQEAIAEAEDRADFKAVGSLLGDRAQALQRVRELEDEDTPPADETPTSSVDPTPKSIVTAANGLLKGNAPVNGTPTRFAKETALANAITFALGFSRKEGAGRVQVINDPDDSRYGITWGDTSHMHLADGMRPRDRMAVFFRELGHQVIFMTAARVTGKSLDALNEEITHSDVNYDELIAEFAPELYAGLKADYDKWLASVSREGVGLSEVLASRGQPTLATMTRRSEDPSRLLSESSQQNMRDFDEWLGDQIGRALDQHPTSQSLTARFFAEVASAIKRMYNLLARLGGVEGVPEKWQPAPSVKAWVDQMFKDGAARAAAVASPGSDNSSTPTVEDLEEARRMSDDAAPQANTPVVNRDDSPGEVGIRRNDVDLTGPKSAQGYLPKDQAKSHKATGFIGKGRAGSSTDHYRKNWGTLANTGKYDEKDILFVSSNGNSPKRVSPLDPGNGITELLDAAIEAGAKLILDTSKDRRRVYNLGERQVAAYLESKGYKEIGTSGVFSREGQSDFGDGTEGLIDPANRPVIAPMLAAVGTTADTAIAEAYPEVRQNSALTRGFMAASKLPAYFKEANPLAAVTTAIAEMDLSSEIQAGYQDALALAADVAASIMTKVEAFANQGRTSPTQRLARRQLLGSEWSAHMDKPNLRIGHLLQEAEDGRLVLPQKIAEAVGLAAANFVTNSTLGQAARERTAQELIQDLGLPENTYLTPGQVARLNRGASQDLGLAELANAIETFMGVRTNPEVPVGLNRAITGALAGDVMMELVDRGFIERTATTVALPSDLKDSPKAMDVINVRVITPRDAETQELHASVTDPTVIERAVFGEELEGSNDHIGKAPKAKETRHNQDILRNTPEQVKLIQRANDQAYFANVPLFAFMRNLGLDTAKRLFADGALEAELTNVNDAESSAGRNRQLEDAYAEMVRLGSALTKHADEKGVSPAEVAKHYTHNIAKSGRLHMFGKSNPQGSKFMRALMLPTWDTLDMNLQANQDLFDLAVAQGLGVKVHTKEAPAMKADLAAFLDRVPKFRAALKKWAAANGDKANLTDSRNPFLDEEALTEFQKAGFGDPLWAMHVLMEQARLEVARDNGTAGEFRTSIYVEADGVTNGPANALMMFMGGAMNWERWVKNAAKVGRSFGTALSLQELRNLGNTPEEKAEAGTDLYQATGNTLTEILDDSWAAVMDALTNSEGDMDEEAAAAYDSLRDSVLELLDLLSGGDVTFDGTEITIKRGITKNPLTITLYGSGARGIAENVVNSLLEELYAQMSQTLRQTGGQGTLADMFSGDPEQATKVARLEHVLDALTAQSLTLDKEGKPEIRPAGKPAKVESLKDFTLSADQFKAMVTNMQTVFIDPMREAIETEVGNSVTEGMKQVQDLTIIQSLVAERLFGQKVAERLEALKNAPRDSKTGLATKSANNYLSQVELDEILQEVLEVAPPITTASGQTFSFLAQERSAPLSFTQGGLESESTSTRYMGESTQNIGFTPRVGAVRRIGVAAVPGMVIGLGDANMIQESFLDGPGLPNAMGVFDGVHVTLSNLAEQSERLNRAVLNGWARNNPVGAVLESYAKTMEYLATLPDTRENRDLFDDIGEVIERGPKGPKGVAARDLAVRALPQVALSYATTSALNQALVQGLSGGVDQMATGSSPAVVNGVDVSHLSPKELAALLAQEARARTDLSTKAAAASNPNAARQTRALREGGAVATGTLMELADGRQGPLKMGSVELLRLTRDPSFPKEYAEILREVLRSRAVEGWEVVIGTGQELVDSGEPVLALEDGQLGVATLTGPNQGKVAVRLDNDNPEETLTHELLHVGTLQLMRDYFSGRKISANAKLAIENLIDLSTRFDRYMQENFESTTNEGLKRAMRDYMVTKARINRDTTLSNTDRQAMALSEFVSWTLANPALREALKSEPSKGWMPQLLRKVKESIRRMFWGKTEPGPDTTNVLGAIQFWSTVVVRTEPKGGPPGPRGGVRAFHSTSAPVVTGFARATQAFLASSNARNQTVGQQEVRQAIQDGVQAKLAAEAAGFPLIGENADAFSSTYVALKALPLDSMSVGEVGKLHRHALRELRPVHFSDDRTVSQEQRALYDYVMGTDQETFAALAAASPDLRKVLAKLDAPKRMQAVGQGLTLDEQATVVANNAMERLQQMATRADNSKDVVRAMDTLLGEMSRRAGSDPSFLDQAVTGANGLLTQLEDKIVAKMGEAGEAGRAKADEMRAKAKGRAGRTAANVLEMGTALLDDAGAEAFGESALSLINKVDGFQPVRRFIADLVGTNDSNEGLLSLVKKVRSGIQQERNRLRTKLPEYFAKQFSRKVTAAEWKASLRGLGQSDLPALLSGMTRNMALDTLRSDARLADQISRHEAEVDRLAGNRAAKVKANALLLAKRMAGERNGGTLRNAYAVALGVGTDHRVDHVSAQFAQAVDRLATLYNLRLMDTATKESLRGLLASDSKAVGVLLDFMVTQRKQEMAKINAAGIAARLNHEKGYMPNAGMAGRSITVAPLADRKAMEAKGYRMVGEYEPSSLDPRKEEMAYYYTDIDSRGTFNQGIVQTVQHSGFGVLLHNGKPLNDWGTGLITRPSEVERVMNLQRAGLDTTNGLEPLFDKNGDITAYARPVDRSHAKLLMLDDNLATSIANWEGRLVEEAMASEVNMEAWNQVKKMADAGKKAGRMDEFIDLFGEEASKMPVVQDAISLFPKEVREQIEAAFGKDAPVWVRKDMLEDLIGYRTAAVTDFWTGTTNWSPQTQRVVRDVVNTTFGPGAYKWLAHGDRLIKGAVLDAREMIAMKSGVVPVINIVSNVLHLISRGVSPMVIAREIPRKLTEIQSYVKMQERKVALEIDQRARPRPEARRRIEAELLSIDQSMRKMSIWPLIEAGEFTALTDLGLNTADLDLTNGRLSEYLGKKIDQIPNDVARSLAHNLVISRDSALYVALQKSVHYGDFIGKAVMYDHLIQKKNKAPKMALRQIADEFVNYDRLPGRARGTLETYGLLWFYNFKIRSVKVAASTIRNNPLHLALAAVLPLPDVFNGVGLPIGDNIFTKAMEGSLNYSIGPGMGLHSWTLNPWFQMVN